jgi:hypothetical protein
MSDAICQPCAGEQSDSSKWCRSQSAPPDRATAHLNAEPQIGLEHAPVIYRASPRMAAPFVIVPTCTRFKLPDWNLESRAPNPPIAVIATVARVLSLSAVTRQA